MKKVILSVFILLLLLIACSDNGGSKSGSAGKYIHEEGTFSQNRFRGSWSAEDMIFDFGTDSLYLYQKDDENNFNMVILPYSISSNEIGDALDGFNDTLKIGALSDQFLIYAFTQDKIDQILIKLCIRDGVFVNERIKKLDVYSGIVKARTTSLKNMIEIPELKSVAGNTFVTRSDDFYADGEVRHSELDLTKGGEMVHFFLDGRCVTFGFSDIDSLETESYEYHEFLTYEQDGEKVTLNNESCYYLENGALVWKSQGETAFTNDGEFIYSYYTPYKGELPTWIK